MKKKDKLSELERKNPFTVPEGYFENFTENLMAKLPEREVVTEPTVRTFDKIRPWLYMAAFFAGLALIFKVIVGDTFTGEATTRPLQAETNQAAVSQEDEEYLDYIEAQYTGDLLTASLWGLTDENEF